MDYSKSQLRELGKKMLHTAFRVNRRLGSLGDKEIVTTKDIVLEADVAISKAVSKVVLKSRLSAILWTEEFGNSQIGKNEPRVTIAFDDIDGTYNKKHGEGILPYCSIVTIFNGASPLYRDALYAGIIIHNTNDLFEAIKGEGVLKNGNRLSSDFPSQLRKDSPIYVNHHETSRATPTVLKAIGRLEARTISRDVLSSGVAFALVAQHGHAYIGGRNKAHELGAGYLFMKELGGTILDFEGNDIGPHIYNFNESKSMIAAVTEGIAQEILREIKTHI